MFTLKMHKTDKRDKLCQAVHIQRSILIPQIVEKVAFCEKTAIISFSGILENYLSFFGA